MTINNEAEQDFINSTILADDAYPFAYFWIGFTDRDTEGVFTWASGEPVSFTNWAPGEPNNAGDEDFGLLNYHYGVGVTSDPADKGN